MCVGGLNETVLNSFLIFHKIQLYGTTLTAFGVVRTHSRDSVMGSYSDNIVDPNYNFAGAHPNAVRIYGLESFLFTMNTPGPNNITISTADGIYTVGYKSTDPSAGNSYPREFYASYYNPCPQGCICAIGVICSSCELTSYRVHNPVTVNGVAVCPCLPGFYEGADHKTCLQCTPSLYCDTCELNSMGDVDCTACKCSHHRELNSAGVPIHCTCRDTYQEPTPAGPYCVKI